MCHTVALVLAECPNIRDIHHGLLSLVDPLIALGLVVRSSLLANLYGDKSSGSDDDR